MTLRLDFDGIADGTTMKLRWNCDGTAMAQASTLVPITKMKKHKRGRLRYHGGLFTKWKRKRHTLGNVRQRGGSIF